MACDLTRGRKDGCKDQVGGLKAIYFTDFGDLGTITYADAANEDYQITDLSGTFEAFKYELKGNSNFEQTITANLENGTTFFEQSLNVTLKQLTKEDHKELKLLSYGRPHIAVEDYNGNVFLMGVEHGAELSGGTVATGAGMGDLSGYTLTFSAMERRPANFLDLGATPDPANATYPYNEMASATPTVTAGTN